MKYLSLFSGIGGFELGMQNAIHNIRPDELANSQRPEELHNTTNQLQQWECVGYSEIDKEELYSLTSLGFLKKSDQETSYWKTSKGCFLMTMEELSKPSSPRLMNWGIVWNGKCLTQRISVSHRIGKECSLSDILEESPNEKYFLSQEATQKILTNLTKEKAKGTEFTEQTG